MAQITVCDICPTGRKDLQQMTAEFVHVLREEIEDDPTPGEGEILEEWKVRFMCSACRERARKIIKRAMTPPTPRKKKTPEEG